MSLKEKNNNLTDKVEETNNSYNVEDVVESTIDDILMMAKELDILEEAKIKTEEYRQQLKEKEDSFQVLIEFFNYFKEIKSAYDKKVKTEENLSKYEELSSVKRGVS